MPTIDVTEYSAIGLLFVLAIAGGWIAWRWLDGYNRRAEAQALAEQERLDQDYEDRRRLTQTVMDLVARDIEAKQELAATLQALRADIERNNGAMEQAMNEVCRSLHALAEDQQHCEHRAQLRHEELLARLGR